MRVPRGRIAGTEVRRVTRSGMSDSMPSTACPSAILASISEAAGTSFTSLGGTRADVVGQQQFAARRRPQALHVRQRALVRDRERADRVHLVAKELDAHGVRVGGREHVNDPAAHGELATLLHHVDTGVRRGAEGVGKVGEVALVPHLEVDGFEIRQARHDGLQQRADGRDHHLHGRDARLGFHDAGVDDPAQRREAARHGVGAGAQALVRQRLPGGQDGNAGRVAVATERGGERVGVSARGSHHQERAVELGVRHQRGSGGRCRGEVRAVRERARSQGGEQGLERLVHKSPGMPMDRNLRHSHPKDPHRLPRYGETEVTGETGIGRMSVTPAPGVTSHLGNRPASGT
ncbi:hypothetical protein GCM10025876_12100 [Demequina litorisediminis]|uniref:Uncharacterized protein n=1 Tax=Demequina litorisediminis TaxID=1849022 RepID=A0ABQ6IBD4_9MICO|nr:hypothetical protein GCM10025876_12100 [Demequina litorisediminis]